MRVAGGAVPGGFARGVGNELVLWTVTRRGCAHPLSKGVSVSEPPARLAVRNVEDLVGLVPFLIGFHPADSLVILVLEEGRVAVTARVDLAAVVEPVNLIDLVGRIFDRFPGAQGWFLAYTDKVDSAWPVLESCAELIGSVRLGRLIQVTGEGWFADHANGPAGQIGMSPVAAEAVLLGMPVRRSRAALAEQIGGPADSETDALLAEFETAAAQIATLGPAARRRLLAQLSATASGSADYVRLAVLVVEPAAQLEVLERLDQRNAVTAVRLWTAVIQHSLVPYLAAPLGLLGVASWLTGDGAMQTVCLERLDRLDPLDPLAALLDWINTAVLPPAQWMGYRTALLGALADQARLMAPWHQTHRA